MTPQAILELGKAAERELIRRKVLPSTLEWTKHFFKVNHRRNFVVNEHHEIICAALDKVYSGEIKRLIINIAPRYGKTELAVKNFMAKGLAINPASKFIHLSYSDDLALDNSEEVKEIVKEQSFSEIFPDLQIKKGSDSKKKWYTTAGGGVYATSAAGQVTGFGAGNVDEEEEDNEEFDMPDTPGFGGAIVIDDPIKPEDAESEQVREKVNKRFDTTIRSRLNSRNTPIIIIMQRLHPNDLVGHVTKTEPGEWTVISLPSVKADGTALWPFKHSLEELQAIERIDKVTFGRQHMQNPKPREGLLYRDFKTYGILPGNTPTRIHVDVADTGSDNLCAVAYKMINNLAYVVDVIHTKERAESTEMANAEMATRQDAELCRVESNNGGRFFGRNSETQCRNLQNYRTRFEYYTERKNKESRILNSASAINNFFIMPVGWEMLFPSFYADVTNYMAVGKNEHDDGPDTLTGIYEHEVIRSKVGYGRRN